MYKGGLNISYKPLGLFHLFITVYNSIKTDRVKPISTDKPESLPLPYRLSHYQIRSKKKNPKSSRKLTMKNPISL